MKVQLKARPTIAKKYIGKNIYIAFPIGGHWYLIEHDVFFEKIGKFTNWLETISWKEHHQYSSEGLNKLLLEDLSEFRISDNDVARFPSKYAPPNN